MSRSLLTNETSELDLLDQRPFDQTDFDILKSYEAVVDGLAMLIGSHCEIVLHSLQDLKCSAIRIANGEHTGRKIGSPITDLALRMLHDMTGADSSVSKCYFTRAKSGVLMKSVTIAIRNREHRVIGLLCINMNLDVPFSQKNKKLHTPHKPTRINPTSSCGGCSRPLYSSHTTPHTTINNHSVNHSCVSQIWCEHQDQPTKNGLLSQTPNSVPTQ